MAETQFLGLKKKTFILTVFGALALVLIVGLLLAEKKPVLPVAPSAPAVTEAPKEPPAEPKGEGVAVFNLAEVKDKAQLTMGRLVPPADWIPGKPVRVVADRTEGEHYIAFAIAFKTGSTLKAEVGLEMPSGYDSARIYVTQGSGGEDTSSGFCDFELDSETPVGCGGFSGGKAGGSRNEAKGGAMTVSLIFVPKPGQTNGQIRVQLIRRPQGAMFTGDAKSAVEVTKLTVRQYAPQ